MRLERRWAGDGLPRRALEPRRVGAAVGRAERHAGALEALASLGIDETRRAETISVAEFVAIAKALG